MDKTGFDEKLAQVSKSIMSYCITRTRDRYDAEDLAQDILTELIKSACNIRDDRAFYGFMWAVAGKVYAMWCRKRARGGVNELPDDLADNTDYFDIGADSDLYLLRRELTLLSEKYRRAAILYYVENKSCSEISAILGVSESMVKYLLFKARKILKEGMDMERNYGEQSYNPKNLALLYMGEGPNRFWSITNGRKIPQNILWACYNDSLTGEEISLQIGVASPYLEEELKTLEGAGLLIQKGGRYSTNIIIFENELKNETASKTEKQKEAIADEIHEFIIGNENKIREIGFHMHDMSKESFNWHITCAALWLLFDKLYEDYKLSDYPVTAFGDKAYVWGDESPSGVLNCYKNSREDGTLDEGEMRFLDYLPNPNSDHHYVYRSQNYSNITGKKYSIANTLIRLASGKEDKSNELELSIIADLIKHGYAVNDDGVITVTTPVYTKEQINELHAILSPLVADANLRAAEIKRIAEAVLLNHVPPHLKKDVPGIIVMRMFYEVISSTVEIMCRKDYLKTSWNARERPTVYMVID